MENKTYRTKDLGEASALVAKQITLIEIDREDGVCWFIFQDESLCRELSNQYFFGNFQVNARVFYEATIRLKNRIFNR